MALAGTSVIGNAVMASPMKKGKEIMAIQLYSIRDEMKQDPLGTLKLLAAQGYKDVEHANYVNRKFYGYTPSEFKKILKDLGMKMSSGHTVLGTRHWDESKKDFTDAWKYTVEDAAFMGQKYVISPSMEEAVRKDYNLFMKFMELFNKSGELCKKSGMKFGYHNHHFEFAESLNGKTLYDIILQNTDANLVIQQLDIGNMYNAGVKALDIMKKYPKHFESMHVKDEIESQGGHDKYESTILGKGLIPVKEIMDLGRQWGTLHYVIEQEAYQGIKPIDCMKENIAIVKKWGY